jgi:hypothetical protein
MRFYKSSIPFFAAALVASAAVLPANAFNIENQAQASEDVSEVSNRQFERAALLEARAYICGTDEASEAAMKAGMRETGLPEDIAVEIVSDLASGLIDSAEESGSKEICGKAKVQLSGF